MSLTTAVGHALDRNVPWAIRPETLTAIAAHLAGELTAEQLQALTARGQRTEGTPTGGVAVVSLRGVVTPRGGLLSQLFGLGGGLETFRAAVQQAVADDSISAVVLDLDSPGGSTDLVAETAAELRAARGTKPIVAIANTMAASAAYWLASQADELVVTPSGSVGSIGVLSIHQDISAMAEKDGVKFTLISAGKHKTEANPYEPLSDEARAALQGRVDEMYGLFVADVAKGRKVTTSAVKSGFGEGRLVSAAQAVELGMADRVATFEETIARLVGTKRGSGRGSTAADAGETPTLSAEARSAVADVLLG